MLSNYEKMKNSMSETFLQYDQEKMIHKFSLKYDSSYLYLTFIAHKYRIRRDTGTIQWSSDFFQTVQEADYNETMTIYDVLCYSKDYYHLSREFVNINALISVKTGNLSGSSHFFQKYADLFHGKTDALRKACEKLSGIPVNKGDVAYEIPLFSFFPVILCFWEADEEFPPSLQLLADKNALDFMHYETLMFALTHLFCRLQEEMI